MSKNVVNTLSYSKGFDMLSDSDTEYTESKLLMCIEDIVKTLPNRHNLLDIGPGNGKLLGIYRYFDRVVAIEPNKNYCAKLRNASMPNLKIYNSYWEDVNLKEKFDLCLCSHVLYYVPPENWFGFIKKMERHRSKNGGVVITLASSKGDTQKFLAPFLNEIRSFELLKKTISNCDERVIKSTVNIKKDELGKVLEFLLLEYKSRIEDYNSALAQAMEYSVKKQRGDFYCLSNHVGVLFYPKRSKGARNEP